MVENAFAGRLEHFVTAKCSRGRSAALPPPQAYHRLYFILDIVLSSPTLAKAGDGRYMAR